MAVPDVPEYVVNYEDWHHGEVYAKFGVAVYFAQVLEAGVVNHLAFLRAVRRKQRRPFDIDDVFRRLFGQTLGTNIKEIRDVLKDDDWPMADELAQALVTRNELVHHFWRRRIMKTGTDQGRKEMIEELEGIQSQFESVDASLRKAMRILWDEAGIDFEWIEQEYERLTEDARGERDPEPRDMDDF